MTVSSRERMAAYRERQRQSQIIVPVIVWPRVIDLLVRLDFLEEDDAGDGAAVGCAIARFLRYQAD